jgi:catechol 2,3-dioxygenase-like lactoylglutathione lyase family enzyme
MGNLRFRHAIPTLRIASIEKSLPFYKALGFEISWQHQLNPDAPRLTSVTHESVELFLTEHTVAPFGSVVYLVVEGLDEIVAQARAKGIEPSFGPEDRPWGNREAYFTDTDSNVIRLGEQLADTAAESQAGAA